MNRKALALVALAALVWAAATCAATPRVDELRVRACSIETRYTDPIGRHARLGRIRVFANGAEINGSRNGSTYAEWYGRGVAVSLLVARDAGPMRWRVANVRDRCSRVRLVWTVAE